MSSRLKGGMTEEWWCAHEPGTPLHLRHHAARRRADAGRRFLGRGQAPDRARARRAGRRLHRRRLAGRQSDRHGVLLRAPAAEDGALHRVRHDQARRAAAPPTIRACPRCWTRSARCGVSGRQDLGFPCRCRARNSALARISTASRNPSPPWSRRGREALFDAEHFFDGYKANPDYALDCIRAAHDAGARWLVLCDTNGGTMPEDVYRIVVRGESEAARSGTRHPRAQRHRTGGGRQLGRRARRRAADPGHAERARRALRQRQSVLAAADADAEGALRLAIRNRRQPRATGAHDACFAAAG